MQLQQPHRHHGEIGHHVVFFEERAHGAQHLGRVRIARADHLVEGALGRNRPMPSVLERLHLGVGFVPVRGLEQHVIGRARIERRIEIDEVDRLVADVLAQYGEIIAVIEGVGHAPPRDSRTNLPSP
jgi:hypothetical protein